MTEGELHRAIVTHLETHGVSGLLWLHINNNPRSARDGARLKRLGLRKGAPDLLYFYHGQCFGHEIKTLKGKLSAEQKQFYQDFANAGFFSFVTFGLDHAIEQLAELGLCRGAVQ